MKFLQFGRGKWGTNHHRILTALGHVVHLAELPGYPPPCTYTDPPLNVSNIYDAILITCSSVHHFPLIYKYFGQIPIFCEKPVCLTFPQLDHLKKLAANHPDAIFQSGHQLLFMPQIAGLKTRKPLYLVAHRTGAIPRHEGATLSLAVHDIAIAHHIAYTHTGTHSKPTILTASGDLHNAKAILKWDTVTLELLVQSLSPIRMRSLTALSASNEPLNASYIHPDNWAREDLLAYSLESFIHYVNTKKPTPLNGIDATIATMDTTIRLHREINCQST